ncbi:hypothetical protein Y032_0214g2332 [Ancylostoma ceylanicum]|nr:hypothetical protein Y032_0214g2332 [Ancylostoma ceylanicum]
MGHKPFRQIRTLDISFQVMSADFAELYDVKVFTNVGLWPYSDEGVRLWNGTIRLDATGADANHTYKVRCSCHKEHLRYIRCTHGTGKVRMGEYKHLSLKVPEAAISTAIMTVLIDDMDVDLNLFMLEGAKELYFGADEVGDSSGAGPARTRRLDRARREAGRSIRNEDGDISGMHGCADNLSATLPACGRISGNWSLPHFYGEESQKSDTETLVEKNVGSRELKWSRRSGDEKAFDMVSDVIKPVFENTPKGLKDYLLNSTSSVSIWQRLNDMVYPVVLELLQDLGDFARREVNRKGSNARAVFDKISAVDVGNDLAEVVLVRLSEKLRSDFGTSN